MEVGLPATRVTAAAAREIHFLAAAADSHAKCAHLLEAEGDARHLTERRAQTMLLDGARAALGPSAFCTEFVLATS